MLCSPNRYSGHIVWRSSPIWRYRDKAEDESLDTAGGLQSESLQVMSAEEQLIKVSDECREDEGDGIFRHERPRQPFPSEAIVKVVEYALLRSALVVELHHFPVRRLVVVGDDASISVISLPEVKLLSLLSSLTLDDEPARHAFPFSTHIKSLIVTRFRQWATKRLKEYLIKGFRLDDERLDGGARCLG